MQEHDISMDVLAYHMHITSMGVRDILKREKIKPITYNAAIAAIEKITKQTLVETKPETNQNENPMILETMANALSKAVDALSEDNKHLREQNEYANELIRDYLKVNNQKAKSA